MADPFKTYESARKCMYAAMEKESSEPNAAQEFFLDAVSTFSAFLQAASKNRGMYRELEKKALKMQETCEERLEKLSSTMSANRKPAIKDRNKGSRSHKLESPTPTMSTNSKAIPERNAVPQNKKNEEKPQIMDDALDFRGSDNGKQDIVFRPQTLPSKSQNLEAGSVRSTARRRFADSDSDEDQNPKPSRRSGPPSERSTVTESNGGRSENAPTRTGSPSTTTQNQDRSVYKRAAPSPEAQSGNESVNAMINALVNVSQPGLSIPKAQRIPTFPHPTLSERSSKRDNGPDNATKTTTLSNWTKAPSRKSDVGHSGVQNNDALKAGAPRGSRTRNDVFKGTRSASPSNRSFASNQSVSPSGKFSENSYGKFSNRRRSFRIDSDSDSGDEPPPIKAGSEKGLPLQKPFANKSDDVNGPNFSRSSVTGQRAVESRNGIAEHGSQGNHKGGSTVTNGQMNGQERNRQNAAESSENRNEKEKIRKFTDILGSRAANSAVSAVSAAPRASSLPVGSSTLMEQLRVKRDCKDGSKFPTIMAAVEAAHPGQTIQIEPGLYVEEICIEKPLQLRATGDGVKIHVSSGRSALVCKAAGILLSGLTLLHTGGDASKRGRSSARCVEVFSGDVSIIKCDVRSEVGSGIIVADKGSLSVQGSSLQGSGKCGVLVFDGGNLLCNDSVVSRNGLYGIVVQNGGTASIEGNRVNGNKHAGILVHGKGSIGNIRSNDISSNGEMGVGVQNGAEVRLDKNRICSNLHAGLFVDGDASRATVRESEFLENGVRGVGVQSGAEARIQGSHVASNSQEGVFVSGSRSRATLHDNDICYNGTKGVGVQSGSITAVTSNRIAKNLEEGVFISDPGSQCTVKDNNITENGMKGIGVQSGGQADVDGNLISGNKREGVYISGEESKALVQNNDITDNGVKGVGVQDGADAAVEGNRISGNRYVGVHVHGPASRAVVRENDIHSNSLAAVVTEGGGAVQSADNRIDGVHERELVPQEPGPDGSAPSIAVGLQPGNVSWPGTAGVLGGSAGPGEMPVQHQLVVEIGRGSDLPQVASMPEKES